jgi:hypothetical protein
MSGELHSLCLESLIVLSKCVGGAPLFRSGMNGEVATVWRAQPFRVSLSWSSISGMSEELHPIGQVRLESSILQVMTVWRAQSFMVNLSGSFIF